MGLFSDEPPAVRDYSDKITELKTKIDQLESHGMTASADRLRKELKKYDHVVPEKVKPIGIGQIKSQVKASRS